MSPAAPIHSRRDLDPWSGTIRAGVFALCLLAVTLLAYQPAWHGRPISDDLLHLPRAEDRSVEGLVNFWVKPSLYQQYHPLVDSVFWLGDRLWGSSMLGHHLLNISLHVGVALLLFAILRRLQMPGAWLAAALFALHPVQVESVAYLNELKNILSALFLFAAVLAYLRFDELRDRKFYGLAALFVVVGLFAKTVTGFLPALILIALWWRRGRIEWRRDVRPLLPFFLLGIAGAVATGWMEREFSGAKGPGFDLSPVERILLAGQAFWFYLAKIFWPEPLMMMYPRWNISASSAWQYFYPAGALLLLTSVWMIRRKWRGAFAGLFLFTLLLFPVLGFFDVRIFLSRWVADHFQYLPIIGIVAPLAAVGATYFGRGPVWRRNVGIGLGVVVLGALTAQTWRHSATFKDAEACYADSASKNPGSWFAQGNLGIIRLRQGKLDEAEWHLRKVLEIALKQPVTLAAVHHNLGHIAEKKGESERALEHFEESLELWPDFRAHNSIGAIRYRQGRLRGAVASYKRALAMQPSSPVAQTNLAWVLATAPDDSLRDGPRALGLSLRADEISGGSDPFFLHTLAAAQAENGQFSQAIATARRALEAAEKRGLRSLTDQLLTEIALYELGLPYRETVALPGELNY